MRVTALSLSLSLALSLSLFLSLSRSLPFSPSPGCFLSPFRSQQPLAPQRAAATASSSRPWARAATSARDRRTAATEEGRQRGEGAGRGAETPPRRWPTVPSPRPGPAATSDLPEPGRPAARLLTPNDSAVTLGPDAGELGSALARAAADAGDPSPPPARGLRRAGLRRLRLSAGPRAAAPDRPGAGGSRVLPPAFLRLESSFLGLELFD